MYCRSPDPGENTMTLANTNRERNRSEQEKRDNQTEKGSRDGLRAGLARAKSVAVVPSTRSDRLKTYLSTIADPPDHILDDDVGDIDDHVTDVELYQRWVEDPTFILDDVKDHTLPYLMQAPWVDVLPLKVYLKCVQDFYHDYVVPLVHFLLHKIQHWDQTRIDHFIRLEGTFPFPDPQEVLVTAARHYCAVHSLTFKGEEPTHKLLR
ncbi:hypothetical protein VNI00_016500 [Paramarasmius palmivorus]|uniref:Uncharacterized protein n=1 Tax=Paramarasmius palmivorus TaxID=297713 RepID=A0AAW0BE59_9AGAR